MRHYIGIVFLIAVSFGVAVWLVKDDYGSEPVPTTGRVEMVDFKSYGKMEVRIIRDVKTGGEFMVVSHVGNVAIAPIGK